MSINKNLIYSVAIVCMVNNTAVKLDQEFKEKALGAQKTSAIASFNETKEDKCYFKELAKGATLVRFIYIYIPTLLMILSY